MFATLIAILLSVYLYFFAGSWNPGSLFPFAMAASAILLSFGAAALLVSFLPIQKGEQTITPRLSELFRKDMRINFGMGLLFCLPLIIIAVSFLPSPIIPMLLLLGVGIDVLYLLIRRIMDYLNPFRVVDFLKAEAIDAIDKDKDKDFCNLIESCSEVAIKSTQRHNSALANHALDALEESGEKFLASSKRLSHPIQNKELADEGVSDSLNYILLFLLQHLEAVHSEAIEKKQEIIAGHVITIITKLADFAANVDLSLTALPLHYINKLAESSMDHSLQDVGIKASIGLLKLAENISKQKDLQYMDLKPPFFTIISILDNVAKITFKNNKEVKIFLLVQPFKDLKSLFEKEPLKSHQDSPAIVNQVDLTLAEFTALESVLATMPPIPTFASDQA